METHLKMVVQDKSLNDIDSKLQQLHEGFGKDAIRASLFNLLIFSKKGAKDSLYEKLIQSVIAKFPCRVIWIRENFEEKVLHTHVKGVSISANIFCEIIEIEFGPLYKDHVASLVLPHIVPDLPFYLLWTEDPTQKEPIFTNLAPMATKIIFDTSYIENLHDFYLNTLKLSREYPGVISDLNWSYIKGWRHLFAAVFNAKEALMSLINCQKITISYHAATLSEMKHNEIRAAYFQGWLAACFQWRFKNIKKEKEIFHLTYSHSTGDLSISLIPQSEEGCKALPPGALLSCEIESHGAHFCFRRDFSSRQVIFQYSDTTLCELPHYYYLPGIAEGQEILEEIFYKSEEVHYRNTLDIVSQIPWSAP